MGSRALVAYEQASDEYELHYSHWGADGRSLHQIGPDTPYADGGVDADVWDGEHVASLRRILDELMQYGTWEAFYIVHDDWSVDMWVPLEYGTPGRGALVPVSTYRERESGQEKPRGLGRTVGYLNGVWETATDLHDSEEDAIQYVDDTLWSRYAGSTGRAAQYDNPMLSTERNLPPQFQQGTMNLSEMMGAKQ